MNDTPKQRPSDYVRKGWCQGSIARDAQGKSCLETSPDAVQWCLYGAVSAAYPYDIQKRGEILDKLPLPTNVPLGRWNDDPKRTQAEVIALLTSIGE